MKDDFETVDFVIKGEIIGIKDLGYPNIENTLTYKLKRDYIESSGYFVQVNVSEVFKGSPQDTVTITPRWTNCDLLFEKNSEYIIFGYRDKDGNYRTNMCTNTFKMNSEDMSRLKAIIGDDN
ncbi:hypothetical protein G3570_10095 [Balneolaceae bacterium YR4-1]|uniref:Uncharacterized protein n=2 Tax=Halalkalibaculum roseum TaxID=2709311 RepID=A0A6M1T4S1_9BACT|nr:hypothetical protein [Halalkalibaculum roseum]